MRTTRLIREVGLLGLGASIAFMLRAGFGGDAGQSDRDRAHAAEKPGSSGHGEDADSPAAMPAPGWFDVLKRTFHEVGRDRVLAVAAGVTFYGLLAVFPAIGALVSLYGLFASPSSIGEHLGMLQGVLPEGAFELVRERVEKLAGAETQTLGLSLLVSLGLSIWSANAGMKAVFDALNVAYGEEEKRGFFTLNLASLAFTFGTLVFVLLAIGAIVAVPVILDMLHLGEAAETVMSLGRWPVMVLVLMTGLALLYRFGPSRDRAQWRWVSPGALVAAALWIVGSGLFSWYVANFENYDETYGAVGGAIGLMMWMWLSATIVLLGAEFNSEAERQTHKDTTEGPPQPMGLRGADAADRKA